MSWDIFVQDIPDSAKSAEDIPEGFQPKVLGTRPEIISKIQAVAPMANFSDPSWGTIEGPGFSIEVSLGDREQIQSFAFHVRGGDEAAGVVADILQRLDIRAIDPASDTGLFDPSTAAESLSRWRAYRDQVVATSNSQLDEAASQAASTPEVKERKGVHPDLNALFKALLPLAKKLIIGVGQFAPFGASMAEDGKVTISQPSSGEEQGEPQELVDLLTGVYRHEAEASKIRAAGICSRTIITVPGQTEKKRAICIALEHSSGQSFLAYVPYRIEYDPRFAHAEHHSFSLRAEKLRDRVPRFAVTRRG